MSWVSLSLGWLLGCLGSCRRWCLGGVATLLVVGAYLKLFPELRQMKEFPRHH